MNPNAWLLSALAALPHPTAAPPFTPAIPIRPLVGIEKTHTVAAGETLLAIARLYCTDVPALMRLNKLSAEKVEAGAELIIPSVTIPPRAIDQGIVLDIPQRVVYVFRGKSVVGRYAVAVGKPSWPTPIGTFRVRTKIKNPSWEPPQEMLDREGAHDVVIPPGPKNPLGDRWMGWDKVDKTGSEVGFHGTDTVRSIGKAISHACVRMYPEEARRMFDQVTVGMPLYSTYEPVKLGKRQGMYFLSVSPDFYRTGRASLESVRAMLDKAGLLPLVDEASVREIVARQDGYPRRIAGVDEVIEVDGHTIGTSIAPVDVGGEWVVPAVRVAEALGASVTTVEGQGVQIAFGGHTLTIDPPRGRMERDGVNLESPLRPTVVEGMLLVPLAPLADLCGAKVSHEKGRALLLTTATNTTPAPPAQDAPPREVVR